MTFARRGLRYIIELNQGAFNLGNTPESFDNGASTLDIDGLRSVAILLKAQGGSTPFVSHAQIQLWGMKPSDMAKISTLGLDIARINKNAITVFAYDEGNSANASQVFSGTISNARLNYNAMPDVSLELECYGTYALQTQAIPATSVQGSGDVATMLKGICAACNPALTLVNNGVTAKLSNPAHSGSAFNQINDICQAAGIPYKIEGSNLIIWNPGQGIDSTVATTGPANGMVGYPEYNMMGFDVTMEFNPEVQVGRKLQLLDDSSAGATPVPGIPGTYFIWGVDHQLSSQLPDGPWFTRARIAARGTYPHS